MYEEDICDLLEVERKWHNNYTCKLERNDEGTPPQRQVVGQAVTDAERRAGLPRVAAV